jgi:tripartite-type tricarboxylate transporter receptor subunit TctC
MPVLSPTLTRRATLAAGLALPFAARAQGSYPERPIRLIVPLAPGGVADIMARLVAEHLQRRWGQPVTVDNRPGAGTTIGMDLLARATPDGYTIGLGNIASHAIAPALMRGRTPYDPLRDFAPITVLGITPSLLVVNAAAIPARTVPELIAHLRANPDQVSYGSSGIGTSLHVGMEMFLQMSGTRMVHVPYRGSAPMVTDLVAGRVQVALDAASTAMPHVQTGRLRALAVTTRERAFFAPDLPPIGDYLPGFDVSAWHGMMAPAATPAPILERLGQEIRAYLTSPEGEERLRGQGVIRSANSADEFAALIRRDLENFRRVVEAANIQPE